MCTQTHTHTNGNTHIFPKRSYNNPNLSERTLCSTTGHSSPLPPLSFYPLIPFFLQRIHPLHLCSLHTLLFSLPSLHCILCPLDCSYITVPCSGRGQRSNQIILKFFCNDAHAPNPQQIKHISQGLSHEL